ncbi:DUF6518 family protein [Microlunatus flavus]|uniref:Uncharacterized protein n=1 Tax=Microlunatus flavus TaxID=1036181 RepID=A0A1H9FPG9_9ACTN|nr:DUF6518 family protein [Microlunatus flavus]SEQ39782.1 hypothetical protein SAMN05421756_103338 [Microlunatus flavus]
MPTPTPPPTTLAAPRVPGAAPLRGRRSWWGPVLVPVVVGVALGPLDLLLQRVLPYPFANLANSPAVWALVAFALGWSDRSRTRWWPPVACTLALVLAVETYYLAAVLALGDDVATLTSSAALVWLALAVAAGVVFGTAGSWARTGHPWRAPVGTAAAVGVLLAEAGLDLARSAAARDDPAYRHDLLQTAVVLVLGAAVVALVAARSGRQRLVGCLLALVLATVGALVSSAVLL